MTHNDRADRSTGSAEMSKASASSSRSEDHRTNLAQPQPSNLNSCISVSSKEQTSLEDEKLPINSHQPFRGRETEIVIVRNDSLLVCNKAKKIKIPYPLIKPPCGLSINISSFADHESPTAFSEWDRLSVGRLLAELVHTSSASSLPIGLVHTTLASSLPIELVHTSSASSLPIELVHTSSASSLPIELVHTSWASSLPIELVHTSSASSLPIELVHTSSASSLPIELVHTSSASSLPIELVHTSSASSLPIELVHTSSASSLPIELVHTSSASSLPIELVHISSASSLPIELHTSLVNGLDSVCPSSWCAPTRRTV
ncbi:hypothetical protein PCANC_09570 [Puccinia coronata f. sp. avenae]|uniref:Uncharacterized protein n=1 Tax=Puccinia coronata f. sp. avenae TaxID=200324 RepID=A0A2N5V9V2_9BASI|nr:hypothetical protein PCANC_09570 [Puccinia coronata f. sp. avenae]